MLFAVQPDEITVPGAGGSEHLLTVSIRRRLWDHQKLLYHHLADTGMRLCRCSTGRPITRACRRSCCPARPPRWMWSSQKDGVALTPNSEDRRTSLCPSWSSPHPPC